MPTAATLVKAPQIEHVGARGGEGIFLTTTIKAQPGCDDLITFDDGADV